MRRSDAVAAFTKTFGSKSWQKDVLNKSVPFASPAYVVYQFNGHPWTIFDYITLSQGEWPKADAAEKLSTALKGKAMYFAISDTAGHYEYTLFDGRTLVQRYCDSEAGFEFDSTVLGVSRPKQSDLMKHFDQFMKAQDILIPPFGTLTSYLNLPYGGKLPSKIKIEEEEEFSAENICRADLITLL